MSSAFITGRVAERGVRASDACGSGSTCRLVADPGQSPQVLPRFGAKFCENPLSFAVHVVIFAVSNVICGDPADFCRSA